MLVLPIKKKWFDMIASGKKKEEYREIKPYYDVRFKSYMPRATTFSNGKLTYSRIIVIFRNGYRHDSPQIKCICVLQVGKGKEEWRSRKK